MLSVTPNDSAASTFFLDGYARATLKLIWIENFPSPSPFAEETQRIQLVLLIQPLFVRISDRFILFQRVFV